MTGKCTAGTKYHYVKAFEQLLQNGETVEQLNKANHIALEKRLITLDQFQAAAQVLAKEIMKR